MWKKLVGTLTKKGDMPRQIFLIIYIFKKCGHMLTNPAECSNPRLQNDVTCVCPTALSPTGHEQWGHGTHTFALTHTHSRPLQPATNVQIMGVDVNHHLAVKRRNKIDVK